MDRKLASIRQICDIRPIEDADKIEVAVVDGWTVVVKKGEFCKNQLAVYFEIDSWIPHALAPFLTREGETPRIYEGVEGQKLKTVRLRGQISQGLLLPLSVVLDYIETIDPNRLDNIVVFPGIDLTEPLGILKWEAPVPAQLAGMVRGGFPSFLRRTDQERIQNLTDWWDRYQGVSFEATMKLDGSSMTVYHYNGETGVCSRNLNLKHTPDNTLWKVATETQLVDCLTRMSRNLAVQGELMGEGVQGNREALKGHMMFVFDIWDIDAQRHLTPTERKEVMTELTQMGCTVQHVPIIHESIKVFDVYPTMSELLESVDGPSLNHQIREGVVFKSIEVVKGEVPSFKAINNKFLLKEK